MLIHPERACEKIKKLIDFFNSHSEKTELVWMPDFFVETDELALDLAAPALLSQYNDLLENYKAAGGKLRRIDYDLEKICSETDIYYGDEGFAADAFRRAGMRVLKQDYGSEKVEIAEELGITEEAAENTQEESPDLRDSGKEESRITKIPEEWKRILKSEGEKKKAVVLYITTVSVMYENKTIAIDKIRRVMETIRQNGENPVLLWRPERIPENLYNVFGDKFIGEYRELISEYKRENWGLIDEADSPDAALSVASAIYGDPNAEVMKAIELGKPVMIQDVTI